MAGWLAVGGFEYKMSADITNGQANFKTRILIIP
jgi:hypothetical protein